MSFKPTFTNYIQIPSESYTGISSSIGSYQTQILRSNLEWQYQFANSQTLLNYQNKEPTTIPTLRMSYPATFLLKSFGPFKINLDKDGNPMPIFVALNQTVSTSIPVGVQYKVYLRLYNQENVVNNYSYGFLNTTSQPVGHYSQPHLWNILTTSNAFRLEEGFDSNSSVLQTKFDTTDLYNFNSRKEKVINSLPIRYTNNQQGAMAFLDVYLYYSYSYLLEAKIHGIYAREINYRKT